MRTFSDLTGRELEQVADAWQNRAVAAREQGFPYVQALVNEGRAAGASLAHSHSQLFWLEEEPPLVAQERAAQEAEGGCVLCRVLAEEVKQRIRIVDERDGLLLLCPFAGRQPYEMVIVPRGVHPGSLRGLGARCRSATPLRGDPPATRRRRAQSH